MVNSSLKSIFAIFFLLTVVNSCSTEDELEIFELVSSVQSEEGGKVTPKEGKFSTGRDVKITAIPDAGYIFKAWSGASVDTSSSITLRMDSDKQITAIFEKLDSDGGNSGFSDEKSTTTSTDLTYVPDDVFEQNLIELGYDDVLDDFVKTENINGITSLELTREFTYFIDDYTGLEAFKALKELTIAQPTIALKIPESLKLKKLKILCSYVDVLDLCNSTCLEELRFYGDEPDTQCNTTLKKVIGLENAINLKVLEFSLVQATNIQEIINSAKSIEQLTLHRPLGRGGLHDDIGNYVVSLVNNSNLREITFDSWGGGILPNFINLKNGANEKIEIITFYGPSNPTTCVQADLPSYIQSIISTPNADYDGSNITVSADCGY